MIYVYATHNYSKAFLDMSHITIDKLHLYDNFSRSFKCTRNLYDLCTYLYCFFLTFTYKLRCCKRCKRVLIKIDKLLGLL